MEVRNIDVKEPSITFDLLKVWACDAFARQPSQTKQMHGWGALVTALCHAARQRARDLNGAAISGPEGEHARSLTGEGAPASPLDEHLDERELRRRLAEFYGAQPTQTVREIVRAKLQDELSLFRGMKMPDVEHAVKKWAWYLYCLTFDTEEFLVRRPPAPVVNVPLDMVDLRIIAEIFNVQITLSRLFEEALRFRPYDAVRATACCHLLLHSGPGVFNGFGGLWAAILDSRSPADEPQPLEGSIVEVSELPLEVAGLAADRAVLIRRFDPEMDCYVATCGDTDFPLERSSIKRVIFTKADLSHHQEETQAEQEQNWGGAQPSWKENTGGSEAPAFAGIPIGSLDFQVLQELVRRKARTRLEHMLAELAGRSAPSPMPAASTSGGSRAGNAPSVAASRTVTPGPGSQQQHQQQPQEQPRQQDPQEPAAQPQPRPQPQQQAPQQPAQFQPPQRPPQEQPQNAPPQAEPQWLDFEVVRQRLESGHPARVLSLSEFRPSTADDRYMPLQANQWVEVRRFHDKLACGSCLAAPNGDKWFPVINIVAYVVETEFAPDPGWPNADSFLRLQRGACVVMDVIYEGQWEGWGFARQFRSPEMSGVVPLRCLRRQVWSC